MEYGIKQIREWRRDSPWAGRGVAIATHGKTGKAKDESIWCFLLQFALDPHGLVLARLTPEHGTHRDALSLPPVRREARSADGKKRPAGSVEISAQVLYQPDRHGTLVALPILKFRLNVNGGKNRAERWLESWHGGQDPALVLLHEPRRQRRTYRPGCGPERESEWRVRDYAIWRIEGAGVPLTADGSSADSARLAERAWRVQTAGLIDKAFGAGHFFRDGLPKEHEAYESALTSLRRALGEM